MEFSEKINKIKDSVNEDFEYETTRESVELLNNIKRFSDILNSLAGNDPQSRAKFLQDNLDSSDLKELFKNIEQVDELFKHFLD